MAFHSDHKLFMFMLLLALKQLVAKPLVPCFYVFGDSLDDNGNNNNLNVIAKSNYEPYGIDFPDGPTGRFTNGRNLVDILGNRSVSWWYPYIGGQEQFLGFDNFIPPYANASGRDILQGVNYASAGAGILDRTGKNLGNIATFTDQLREHQYKVSDIVHILGDKRAASHLRKCLYYVNLGNNDFGNYSLSPSLRKQYTPELFANLLVETYYQKIKELYKYGARKMILVGANLIGCTPFALALGPPTLSKCRDHFNFAIRIFNEKRKPLVGYLNRNFPDAKFTYLDAYALSQELLDNPSRYGFKVTTTACCGHGRNHGQIYCQRNQIPCKNRDEYFFWDPHHPTEAANLVIGKKLFSDEAEFFTYPFTISQLARL